MPDPKKTMVKVSKKLLSKEEESNTPEMIAKFQKINDFNKNAVQNESIAKGDSIMARKKYMISTAKNTDRAKVDAMAGRAGNTAANATRDKLGNSESKVLRYAEIESGGTMDNSRGQQDKYLRNKPVEKDFPMVFSKVKK